jgi:hypothetical protein
MVRCCFVFLSCVCTLGVTCFPFLRNPKGGPGLFKARCSFPVRRLASVFIGLLLHHAGARKGDTGCVPGFLASHFNLRRGTTAHSPLVCVELHRLRLPVRCDGKARVSQRLLDGLFASCASMCRHDCWHHDGLSVFLFFGG